MVEKRADSSAYNNIFAELWLCDVEGVLFHNVTRTQLVTLLKNELFHIYLFRFLTTSGKIPFCKTSLWLFLMKESMKLNVENNYFQGTSLWLIVNFKWNAPLLYLSFLLLLLFLLHLVHFCT